MKNRPRIEPGSQNMPASYKALISDADLKIFIAARGLSAHTIEEISEE